MTGAPPFGMKGALRHTRRPGADRRLGTARSDFRGVYGKGIWWLDLDHGVNSRRVYGEVRRKVRNRFVCRADRAAFRL
jgi:hypothetical protein